MASTSFQNVSHGEYDAFLSFRGEDTRKGFIGHLYTALNNKGIYVFKDDKQLEKGGSISPNLLKAIEESRISIIVLSKNYASSTWCLDELVKIVECKNRDNQIFPIFYDVEPTVVRKQTTTFGEAFAKHEEFFRDNIKKVQKWRHALKVVANISGWELKDRNESEFIEEIVNVISSQIRSEPEILKELVGMESRLEKLRFLMGTGSNDVRMIGIWGMGGLGKTTLARVVYDLMSHEFDGSSFLADVREKCDKEGSVISLQKQLLSDLLKLADNSIPNVYDGINMLRIRLRRKKVLVVIDDVADVEQLQRLVGRRDWFGPGSRILITTRDKQLLVAHEVDEEHILNLDVLNNDEALQLFSMKAFKTHQPVGEYVELSERVLEYAGSLPLALKVLGSFLIGLEYLSNELRLLDWHRYPLKSLPSNLQLDKTVDFKMCYSRIEELWKGIKPLNMLRVLKLSHSENLIKTPDFTKVPNLKVLDLEGCKRLREIHPSLLRHNKLILLNMKGCTSLTTLPGKIFMESLKTLVLSGCSKLKKFPDIVMRSMGDLTELFLDGTSIAEKSRETS
ncbi:hypothetical protein WN943_015499 [Citrus x changshan-huyou]